MPLIIEATEDKATGSWDLCFVPRTKQEWTLLKGVVALIKATIPASDRTYDTDTKHWSILDVHYHGFKAATANLGVQWKEMKPKEKEKFFYEETLNAPVVITKESLAVQLCQLLEITSETLKDTNAAKKAYRAKALAWHPDRNNGDGSKMSELNSVWNQYNDN